MHFDTFKPLETSFRLMMVTSPLTILFATLNFVPPANNTSASEV